MSHHVSSFHGNFAVYLMFEDNHISCSHVLSQVSSDIKIPMCLQLPLYLSVTADWSPAGGEAVGSRGWDVALSPDGGELLVRKTLRRTGGLGFWECAKGVISPTNFRKFPGTSSLKRWLQLLSKVIVREKTPMGQDMFHGILIKLRQKTWRNPEISWKLYEKLQ